MRLGDALFSDVDANIYEVTTDWEERLDNDYTNWELVPIHAATVSASSVGGTLDGLYILNGSIVVSPGETKRAYVGMTLPEGVSDEVYILENGEIIRSRYPSGVHLK